MKGVGDEGGREVAAGSTGFADAAGDGAGREGEAKGRRVKKEWEEKGGARSANVNKGERVVS